ncbi:DUF4279 domain-containing protein [Glycomyces xiaoerkulensis]|uniref:DUF4279 domain-containing protein n=1 Tax=Glycomyces xiaoerkulensis TaxID=2038139 RepID=UPI000C25C5A6|nr:DUF4279 domain-containing protein [Glycomyces xiaoerkulensis]
MVELDRARASLRIVGDDLSPAEITTRLGSDPTRSFARGDKIHSEQGPTRIRRFGLWSLAAADTPPADLDAQVEELLGRLTDDMAVWSDLGARFDLDLFCGWFMHRWNEGATIEADTLEALGSRGIRLFVDLYNGPDEDEDAARASVPDRNAD